jgi:sigma-B regulation protein RsbU (phosphoserine phosphatase)
MQVGSGRLVAYLPGETTLLTSLEKSGYAIDRITQVDDYLPAIEQGLADLALLPLSQPESEQLLNEIIDLDPHPPILVFGDNGDAEVAGRLMEAGADEYFLDAGNQDNLLKLLVDRTIAFHRSVDQLKSDNAQLQYDLSHIEDDRQAGFEVQQRLIPDPQQFGDISFSYQLLPRAGMSGDSVNCFYLSDGRLLFYLSDVAGHGVIGGVVTTALTVTAKNLSDPSFQSVGQSSSDLLIWFNRAMLALELDQHVTMFLGVIDLEASTLQYSSAAHFPGTILCQEGVCQYLELGGLPLGVCETHYEYEQVDLNDEFELVLFSDGVLEILPPNTLENRENHLLTLVESGSRSIGALSADLNLEGRSTVPDDIAVLTLNRKATLP